MRVQNEGTGKSSWWMLNPDAKPGNYINSCRTTFENEKCEEKIKKVNLPLLWLCSTVTVRFAKSNLISLC